MSRRSVVTGVLVLCLAASLLGGAMTTALAVCGPFTDVTDGVFCPFVLEIFYLGITTGTTSTTYDPLASVSRLQMAAFLSRTVDTTLKRGSARAAVGKSWTTQDASIAALTTIGGLPALVKSDGIDLWAANSGSGTVSRVRASDGRLLETWTGATSALGVLVAMGKVFVAGGTDPGQLFQIDPAQPAGAVTTVSSSLGANPVSLVFDGSHIWTANQGGSVSIVTPGPSPPWSNTTVSAGFITLYGAVYDGTNVWVADFTGNSLHRLNSVGAILQTVTLASSPQFPVFDGTNIWVPGAGPSTVSVVRASNGALLQTFTDNGLSFPQAAAFDGERVLVTNYINNSVSLWKAASLQPLGFFSFPGSTAPYGACSDGLNFWVTLGKTGQLARF